MTELQLNVQRLQIALMTKDLPAKNALCDEFWRIIDVQDKIEVKSELCGMLAPHLVDLEREEDLNKCVEILNSNPDYHAHLGALQIQTLWYGRKKDNETCAVLYSKGIKIAENNSDTEALAEGYLMRGKCMYVLGNYDDALNDLNKAIPFAEKDSNYNLIATCEYYIGLVLMSMGHNALGMEKLREASEEAHEQHCSDIIMHTEVVRALKLLEEGEADVAKAVLSGWFDEFMLKL